MLDTLAEAWSESNGGADIWSDKSVKFLDPCTKSGVFLREITLRLSKGLAHEIADLDERVNHILTKQVFGIGITKLTSLLARRSVYCSKHAKGNHSIAKNFTNDSGNIWFERLEHTWLENRCSFCGASRQLLDRGESLESHAYALVHTHDPSKAIVNLFGAAMQFDVVIGNPPYQLQDGGHAASATPIYHKFIEQSIKLDPRFLVMVTPSRWFQGGRGLNDFRVRMLQDKRIRVIVDFIRDKDAFPSINVNGGVNYFLWSRDDPGDCKVTTVDVGGQSCDPVCRSLSEFDVFVRRNEAVPILRKVLAANEPKFSRRVSSLKPFGLRTHFHGAKAKDNNATIKLYGSGAITWVSSKDIITNNEWVHSWKVLIAAATDGNENFPLPIWDKSGPFVSGPNEACTETYLVASLAQNLEHAIHIRNYIRTKFFRFLVSLRKIAQHNKADNFLFVPDVPTDRTWTDRDLYERYNLSPAEILYIDTMIRTVDWGDG